MHRREVLDGFQLNENLSIYHQIGPKAVTEHESVVFESDRLVPLNGEAIVRERVREHGSVHRLKQPWPKLAMDAHRVLNDGAGDAVEF